MMEPWFDANHAWIPGTVYGTATGVMGAVVGCLAWRGRARRFVIGAWIALWAAALVLLGIGLTALVVGQPWGIWYGFVLPGGIGVAVVGANFATILTRYRETEQRRLAAQDLV
jgi:hypothetical protein